MAKPLLKKTVFIFILFVTCNLVPASIRAQAFNFNDFFLVPAITFFTPDSNNMIYDELHNATEMTNQLDSIFPFYTDEFYGAYPSIQVSDSLTFLPGLHQQQPGFDVKSAEVKSAFTLNNKRSYWYAYYKQSAIDTSTAILIFPGSGIHESWQIANREITNYHNLGGLVKDKGLEYGDVYVTVKPNEDFRSIWHDVGGGDYKKLDYDVMGPYTDFMGKNWAANLYIELLAQMKYLQSRYKKVIVMGLSSGGFPVLVCGLEAGVDGINCASGISVSSYTGFPLPNNENPYFSNLFNYYSLDYISSLVRSSGTSTLFSYGAGDCCTNAYEYDTHAMENYLNSPVATCNAQFFYNFTGHTFPCNALDTFFTQTIRSPKVKIDIPSIACAYDSLQVSFNIQGTPPFSMELYKDGIFNRPFTAYDTVFSITVTEAGKYHLNNVVGANNYPLCKSKDFQYIKPTTTEAVTYLSSDNSFLVATETPFTYNWYRDGIFIDSTITNRLASQGSGAYYVVIKDASGCSFKSNTVIQDYPFNVNVYPNPATTSVNILLNENFIGQWNYSVYNIMGQRVTYGNAYSPHASLDFQKFSNGLYNVVIEFTSASGDKIRKAVPVVKR